MQMCPLPRNYSHNENQYRGIFAWIIGLGYQAIAGAGYYIYSISRLSYNYNTIQYRQELHKPCRHGFVQLSLLPSMGPGQVYHLRTASPQHLLLGR